MISFFFNSTVQVTSFQKFTLEYTGLERAKTKAHLSKSITRVTLIGQDMQIVWWLTIFFDSLSLKISTKISAITERYAPLMSLRKGGQLKLEILQQQMCHSCPAFLHTQLQKSTKIKELVTNTTGFQKSCRSPQRMKSSLPTASVRQQSQSFNHLATSQRQNRIA